MVKNFFLNAYYSITSSTLGEIVFTALFIGLIFTIDLIPFMVDANYGWISAILVGAEMLGGLIYGIYSMNKPK